MVLIPGIASGSSLDDISAAYNEIQQTINENTLIIIHVGANDVKSTRSVTHLSKYRDLVSNYKVKSSNIIISCIRPRIQLKRVFMTRLSVQTTVS